MVAPRRCRAVNSGAGQGLTACDAKSLLAVWEIPESEVFQSINVSRVAVDRKARRRQTLAVPVAERLLGVAKPIGQVHQMVEEVGEVAGFSAAVWLSSWLVHPLPELGRVRPLEFLDTIEGQALIANSLRQIQGGLTPSWGSTGD